MHATLVLEMDSYEKDYEKSTAALHAALKKREQLDLEINSLQKRIDALATLIGADYPHDEGRIVLDKVKTPAEFIVNVIAPRATQRVRGLLMAADGPLTSGEIHEKLKQLGLELSEKMNPWALIHGICRRLVSQGFAREVDKDGRKAWIIAKEGH
jgi:hypothetical protein